MQDGKLDYTLRDILNKILISRGAPKKKYSIKVPKVRIARLEDLSPAQLSIINSGLRKGVLYVFFVDKNSAPKESAALTPKQQDIISLLEHTVRSLKENYAELSPDAVRLLTNDEYYLGLRKDHLEDIKEAVRTGLIWHPLVFELVYTYKALRNKEVIRRIKRGWETDVKRPIKAKDIKFFNYIPKIEKYRSEGKTWPQIRRILMKRKIIPNITLNALKKKIEKFAPHLIQKLKV